MSAPGASTRPFGRGLASLLAESAYRFPASRPTQRPDRYSIVALERNSVVPIVELTETERRERDTSDAIARRDPRLPLRQPRLRDLAGTTIKSVARMVFAALCDYGNPNRQMWPPWTPRETSGGYLAWPSVARLAEVTDLSERAVQQALRELEEKEAVLCVFKSQGGAPRKGRLGQRTVPARTSCYLITPHMVHRCSESELKEKGVVDSSITPQETTNNPAPHAPLNPARGAPDRSNHHHQRDRTKKKVPNIETGDRFQDKPVQSAESKTGRKTPFSNSLPDDDDGKPKREPLDDPTEELRQRFKERFGDESGAILQTVVADLGFDRQALTEFVAFDDAHTGAPERLKNPGGYYRALVKQFRAARIARIEAEQRERYRAMERTLSSPEPGERAICELGLCNGGGELPENGKYRPCDCAAGQNLSPKVRDLMEQLRQSVA